jgi:hypothetical protein
MAGRPKGYADWTPTIETRVTLQNVVSILREYEAYLPMTARQIFYRLVGGYGFPKTNRAYKNLTNHLVRARRARLIPFGVIRDDETTNKPPFDFANPTAFWNYQLQLAEDYQRERQHSQKQWIEVWCEAGGMVPQLTQVCHPFGISVHSAGGFLSVTAIHEVAKRIAEREVPTVLLHIGDYDPSGDSIFQVIEEDVGAFVEDMVDDDWFFPHRLAVREEHVQEYGLETAPPKGSDSRSPKWELENNEWTAQAEAFAPDVLHGLLKEEIETYTDFEILERTEAQESKESDRLVGLGQTVQADHHEWLDTADDPLDDPDYMP